MKRNYKLLIIHIIIHFRNFGKWSIGIYVRTINFSN